MVELLLLFTVVTSASVLGMVSSYPLLILLNGCYLVGKSITWEGMQQSLNMRLQLSIVVRRQRQSWSPLWPGTCPLKGLGKFQNLSILPFSLSVKWGPKRIHHFAATGAHCWVLAGIFTLLRTQSKHMCWNSTWYSRKMHNVLSIRLNLKKN